MRRACTLSVCAALLCAWSACQAAGVKIGDAAPNWQGLPGIDGQDHSLADYQDAKLVLMVFTCNHCPVAQGYEDRLLALHRDYKDRGLQIVAVNVNNIPEDRLDKMKERAQEKGFAFPYLYDSTQAIGHAYGAKVTPHVFLLDQNRKVVYLGAIDDNKKADGVKTHYVREALDAVLAGRKPPQDETTAFGCGIKYD